MRAQIKTPTQVHLFLKATIGMSLAEMGGAIENWLAQTFSGAYASADGWPQVPPKFLPIRQGCVKVQFAVFIQSKDNLSEGYPAQFPGTPGLFIKLGPGNLAIQ